MLLFHMTAFRHFKKVQKKVQMPLKEIFEFLKVISYNENFLSKGFCNPQIDNIGMVMHSSPIEIYESLDCFKKRVEEMTAEENSKCNDMNV